MIDKSRRKFIQKTIFAASSFSVLPMALSNCTEPEDTDPQKSDFIPDGEHGFFQGVASFDPSQDSIILWTRYTPAINEIKDPPLIIEVSQAEDFQLLVVSEGIDAREENDHTINLDIRGLESNTTYYYRFRNELTGVHSDVGQTKTLPGMSDVSNINFAVVSCSNYEIGYFNVYGAIATSDVDYILHLGDYIYGGSRANPLSGRTHDPATDLIDLNDYRKRYRQYRNDPQLQAAHRSKPFICVWDDNEFANDAYKSGASGHNEDQGDFSVRKAAAMRAWHEYLPCRTNDHSMIYRNFEFGGLVNLIMLDTRMIGRDEQLYYADYLNDGTIGNGFYTDWKNPNRTLLGSEQKAWLVDKVNASNARWQVLGNQVLMGKHYLPAELIPIMLDVQAGATSSESMLAYYSMVTELVEIKNRINDGDNDLTPEERARVENILPYNLGSWDGYPSEREEIYAAIQDKRLISLAGDSHNAWHNELTDDLHSEIGVEFAGSSITSPGLERMFGDNTALISLLEQTNVLLMDDVKYSDLSSRGYMHITFTDTQARVEWIFVKTISELDESTFTGNSASEY
jgi:alkaline phosphatase D